MAPTLNTTKAIPIDQNVGPNHLIGLGACVREVVMDETYADGAFTDG